MLLSKCARDCTLPVIAAFIFQSLQNAKYEEGLAAYRSGDYAAASAAFQGLDDYKDANEWLVKSQYEEGMAAFELGDYATAASKLTYLGGYQDSYDRARYSQAMNHYARGNYKLALETLNSLAASSLVEDPEFSATYRAMMDQAQFMAVSSYCFNKPCKGTFYYAPYSSNGDSKWMGITCTIALNTDGSCKIVIPREENESDIEYNDAGMYIGEWTGTWNEADQSLILESFPGGENWKMRAVTYQQGANKKNGPIIESQETGQHFQFRVFDMASATGDPGAFGL